MELRGEVESQWWWAWPRWAVRAPSGEVELPGLVWAVLVSLSVAMFPSEAGARPRTCEATASERRKWVEVGVGARPEFGLSLTRATSVTTLGSPAGSNRL